MILGYFLSDAVLRMKKVKASLMHGNNLWGLFLIGTIMSLIIFILVNEKSFFSGMMSKSETKFYLSLSLK